MKTLYLEKKPASFPVEGAVLDLFNRGNPLLPNHDPVSRGKTFQGRLGSFGCKLRGMDVTVPEIFQTTRSQAHGGNLIAACNSRKVRPQAGAPVREKTEHESVRQWWHAGKMSNNNCMSVVAEGFKQQAQPVRLQPVEHAGAMLEVLRHADV